jgi:hypothetical protein
MQDGKEGLRWVLGITGGRGNKGGKGEEKRTRMVARCGGQEEERRRQKK